MKSETKATKVALSVSPMLYARICEAAAKDSMTVEEWMLGLINDELDMDKDVQEAIKAMGEDKDPMDWETFKKARLGVSSQDT